jgi:multidrug efflux pump subunit AcrB
MNIADWLERYRLPVLFVAGALVLAGIAAAVTLPSGLFPVTSFPRIRVEIDAGSMPAKQMLIDVTQPLEVVARAVPGAVNVTSTTSRGSAQMFIDFPWGWDMQQALLNVDAAFAQKMPDLPQGTGYDAIQMSPHVIMPVVSYALNSDHVSDADLRRLAQYRIVPLLTAIDGVRRVGVLGGHTPEVQIAVNAQTLHTYGLTLADLATAVSGANTVRAVGRLEDDDRLYLTIGNDAFTSVQSVRDVALHVADARIVKLGDIATVAMGVKPQWLRVDVNGRPAVTFDVFQQEQADSLGLTKEVNRQLDTFMKSQPASIHLYKWYDQTELIHSSISALEEAILIGLLFAAFVILAFLRNWRVTTVALIIVPSSVLITVLLLSALGLTFNIMTLGGIAAAIGLLIDDVIVMIEHIARRAGAPGQIHADRAVLTAARKFLPPLFGSSLATIIIFLPLAFLSGVTGAFFKFLSLTIAAALFISFILSALAAPLLARALIDFRKWHDPAHGRETWLRRVHARLLRRLLAQPLLMLPGLLILAGLGIFAYGRVGTGFLPQMDEGALVIDYYTAPGTSLAETDRELAQVDAILHENRYVDTVSRRIGAGLGGDFKETYQGDIVAHLIDPSRRPSIWTIMDDITNRVTLEVPGIHLDIHQLMGDMIGDMVGRPQPVVIELSANNPDTLANVAPKVADAVAAVPGIEPGSVDDGIVPAGDALEVHVDTAAAAMEGMTSADIESEVYHYLHGAVVTRYLGTVQDIGVRLWLDGTHRAIHRDDLGMLPIRSPNGHVFPLSTVATLRFAAGQPELTRDNLAQIVAVTARIGGGHDLGSTIAAVKHALKQPGLIPTGVYYHFGGEYKQQQMALRGMVKVFTAAAIGEILLLLFLYRRVAIALTIIGCSLISVGAVFVGLWLAGVEFNITAMMGMVMIIGIATEMSIFLVSESDALAQTMPLRDALREAALNRLRPITMSTLAMILALAPLGLAVSGSGDQMLQPLAIAIIAGATVQLPLVLLAMPVIIGLFARRQSSGARE